MSCHDLVCAACTGRVVDGACPTCRAARTELHSHGLQLPAQVLLALAALLAVLLVLSEQLA